MNKTRYIVTTTNRQPFTPGHESPWVSPWVVQVEHNPAMGTTSFDVLTFDKAHDRSFEKYLSDYNNCHWNQPIVKDWINGGLVEAVR